MTGTGMLNQGHDISVEELNNLLRETGITLHCRTAADLSQPERAELARLIRETHGADDETDSETNARIERFVDRHLRAGNLVFDRHIPEDELTANYAALHKTTETMLHAIDLHATKIDITRGRRDDRNKRQIFAAVPIPDKGILRRTHHRKDIVALAEKAGFTQIHTH